MLCSFHFRFDNVLIRLLHFLESHCTTCTCQKQWHAHTIQYLTDNKLFVHLLFSHFRVQFVYLQSKQGTYSCFIRVWTLQAKFLSFWQFVSNNYDLLRENRPSGVVRQNLVTYRVGCMSNGRSHRENLSTIARPVVELL